MRTFVAAAIVLCLSSCNRRTQQIRLLASVDQIRTSFNNGACMPIYDGGSPNFRSQNTDDWLRRCAELRESLGNWGSFRLTILDRPPHDTQTVFFLGTAQFDRKKMDVEFDFRLSGGSMLLDTISFRETDTQWESIPEPLRRYRRFQDPLPIEGLTRTL